MKVQQLLSFNERVAIVTGGGRGIGKFIATGLAEAGADLIIASRKIHNCTQVTKEIEALGVKALPVQCDLERVEDIENLVSKAMDSFGRIDILVNNAGLTWGAPTLEYPLDKWEKVINVNLRSVFLLCKNVANIMVRQNRGKIINITSVLSSFRGASEEMNPAIAYNASKGGITALTLDLAVKLAKSPLYDYVKQTQFEFVSYAGSPILDWGKRCAHCALFKKDRTINTRKILCFHQLSKVR